MNRCSRCLDPVRVTCWPSGHTQDQAVEASGYRDGVCAVCRFLAADYGIPRQHVPPTVWDPIEKETA